MLNFKKISPSRFELLTLRLSSVYSNQLSYELLFIYYLGISGFEPKTCGLKVQCSSTELHTPKIILYYYVQIIVLIGNFAPPVKKAVIAFLNVTPQISNKIVPPPIFAAQ